jgi:cytochrome c553
MRTLLISIAMFLTITGTAVAADADDVCMKCHDPDGNTSLAGAGVGSLIEKMTAIRDGDVKHPPVLKDLSDEDIAALAAALDAG